MLSISSHTEHTRNEFHRWLSIQGMDFISGWAYAEMFKSQISRPNRIDFKKFRVTGPWDHKISVSAKKSKKIHACVLFFLVQRAVLYHWTMQMQNAVYSSLQSFWRFHGGSQTCTTTLPSFWQVWDYKKTARGRASELSLTIWVPFE